MEHKKLLRIIIASIMIICMCICITVVMALTSTSEIKPFEADKYFELRAVEVKEVEGQNKQVIMELWVKNIAFKRF